MQVSPRFQVCKPLTSCHRRGMQWFASLTRLAETQRPGEEVADGASMLNHSVQFYSVYAETGDSRYLEMCEDFLKDAVVPKTRRTR